MPRSPVALILIAAGVVLILVGLMAWFGGLSWFGRLPGDVRIERPNMRVYIPITSMLLVSVAISLIAAIFRAWR